MTTIKITTNYFAPIERVFDTNRNIDIHQQSASKTKEIAIAGITSGLINKNDANKESSHCYSKFLQQ